MDAITERTPFLIATEINSLKEQTRKMVLVNSIEIGRRLTEAKTMVTHGEWGNWLEQSVDYSQSTANNLMRIFEEYGSQRSLFGSEANSQALGNLSYTQAIALLGIPKEEREQFVADHDLDSMSTRELQKTIKEKQVLEEQLKQAEETAKSYKEQAEATKAQASGNQAEFSRLRSSLETKSQDLQRSQQKITELERELKEQPVEVTTATVKEVPEELEKELQDLRRKTKELEIVIDQQSNADVLKYTVYFDTVVKNFDDLLGALAAVQDPEAHQKYKNTMLKLIAMMQEQVQEADQLQEAG